MADTCRGLDASVPAEIREILKLYVRVKLRTDRGKHLDDDKAYCLLELLGEKRCGPDAPLTACNLQGGLVKTTTLNPKNEI